MNEPRPGWLQRHYIGIITSWFYCGAGLHFAYYLTRPNRAGYEGHVAFALAFLTFGSAIYVVFGRADGRHK